VIIESPANWAADQAIPLLYNKTLGLNWVNNPQARHNIKVLMMSMSDRDGVIWFDGKMVPWRDANIHVLTHSLHYGMGIFEGIRAYKTENGTAVFRLAEHVKRLFNGLKIFQMKIDYSEEQIAQAILQVVRDNKLASCYIRPIIFIGSEKLGISPTGNKVHTAIAAWQWGAYLGEDGINKGIRVKTSSFTRHFVNSSLVRANMFMVRNGIVFTPDLASCLDGITRDSIIRIAKDLGFEVREKRITRDEVYSADEAFFTGTAAEVTPIRELDDRTIGDGKRGPITKQIQDVFFDTVYGRNDRYRAWLTTV
jgi:branched-chain amino acid aminotransferase